MKIIIILACIALLSFILGRITKPTVTLPDTRKVKIDMTVNGIEHEQPFSKYIEVDSYRTYDFKAASHVQIAFYGIREGE